MRRLIEWTCGVIVYVIIGIVLIVVALAGAYCIKEIIPPHDTPRAVYQLDH